MHSIKGMYRILDLISEKGSGGLGVAHPLASSIVILTAHSSREGHH